MYITWLLPAASGQGGRQGGLGAGEGWGAGAAPGFGVHPDPTGALGDEHPEVPWPRLGRVPRDKAVAAAVCPRAGTPRGLEGAWGGAGTPGIAAASASRPFWHSPNLPSRKRNRWLEPLAGIPLAGSSREPRGAAGARPLPGGPAVPPSPELADVNMAFVPRSSPAPLPPAHRFQPGPGTRNERGSSSPGTEGKGGRSRLSLQGCSYHQQSPAPAGNGTGHCPQARQVSWGARASPRQLPKCWDEERGPGPASSAG